MAFFRTFAKLLTCNGPDLILKSAVQSPASGTSGEELWISCFLSQPVVTKQGGKLHKNWARKVTRHRKFKLFFRFLSKILIWRYLEVRQRQTSRLSLQWSQYSFFDDYLQYHLKQKWVAWSQEQWWVNIKKWTWTDIRIYSDSTLCTKQIYKYIWMPHI